METEAEQVAQEAEVVEAEAEAEETTAQAATDIAAAASVIAAAAQEVAQGEQTEWLMILNSRLMAMEEQQAETLSLLRDSLKPKEHPSEDEADRQEAEVEAQQEEASEGAAMVVEDQAPAKKERRSNSRRKWRIF